MILQAAQMASELASYKVKVVRLRDEQYFCPSLAWLQKFDKWLWSHTAPFRHALSKKHMVVDCDDFALRCVDRATDSLLRSRTGFKKSNCGHSMGYTDVYIRLGKTLNGITGFHATNIIRLKEGWYFYEPQTRLYCKVGLGIADGVVGRVDFVWV